MDEGHNNDAREIPSSPPGERVRVRGRTPQYGKQRTRTNAARDFARQLRMKSTDAEKRLWRLLRGHRFSDFRFRRQYACGIYFLDFYCPLAKLAVELDAVGVAFLTSAPGMRSETSSSLHKALKCCASGIINCVASLKLCDLKSGTH